jgi:membrane protein implicated in regulation of membrane protease activity
MPEMTPALMFCLIGLALIAAELIIFQLSVFWFLFIGLGALLSAGTLYLMGSQDWTLALSLFVLFSAVVTTIGYRPLKRWQNAPAPLHGNDAIGQQVRVLSAIGPDAPGRVSWSGTDWQASLVPGLSVVIPAGANARIEQVSGIRLLVAPVNDQGG